MAILDFYKDWKSLKIQPNNKLQKLNTNICQIYNQSIPQILTCLFTTYYGDVNPGDVHELILWVKNLTFPQSKPVDTISTKIDDLAAILEIRNEPNSVTKN